MSETKGKEEETKGSVQKAMQHNNCGMVRCWSNLPDDVLENIFRSEEINSMDLVHCSQVCMSWRSVIKKTMDYSYNYKYYCEHYNHVEKEVYMINLPQRHRGWFCVYSSGPWLLKCMCKTFSCFLRIFHCFKDVEINLPDHIPNGFVFPFKFLISTNFGNVSNGGDGDLISSKTIVFLFDGKSKRIAYCWPMMNSPWHMFHSSDDKEIASLDDVMMYKNNLYVAENGGFLVHVFEIEYPLPDMLHVKKQKIKFPSIPSTSCGITTRLNIFGESISSTTRSYLVQPIDSHVDSDPLMVIRHLEWEGSSSGHDKNLCKTTTYFEVFNVRTGKMVECLGDKSIFLARNDSKYIVASIVDFCPSYIYFADDANDDDDDDDCDDVERIGNSKCDYGAYDMVTQNVCCFTSAPFNRFLLAGCKCTLFITARNYCAIKEFHTNNA